MTWPTTPVSTTFLDQGTDEPRLARPDIKLAVDAVNAIAAEFGNVNIVAPAVNQGLTYTGSQWTNANLVSLTSELTNDSGYVTQANIDATLMSEFGNITVVAPTTNQVLQRTATDWVNQDPVMQRYSEPTATVGTTTGTVNVDWASGNQQVLTMTGNVTLGFVNPPASGTITVIVNTNSTNRAITFANTAKFAGNVRTVSTTNTTDIVVATTYDSGATYLISIVKGFE